MQASAPARARKCRYSLRQCSNSALDGFHYCKTHILEDKNSPYQLCSYISSKTGQGCSFAAPKTQKKDSLCSFHMAKMNRARCSAAKKQLAVRTEATESILEDLEHYSSTLFNNNRGDRACQRNDVTASYLAELASSTSDSDEDEKKIFNCLSNYMPDSDTESIDSENDDAFKYAEVLTEEEAVKITRDKLIRLQSLYIEQFKWLQYILKESRRKYLHWKRQQQPSHGSDDPKELGDAEAPAQKKIKVGNDAAGKEYFALRRYHRKHGVEAVLYSKSQERRKLLSDPTCFDGPIYNRYRYSAKHGTKFCAVKSIKCVDRSLPFTRFCAKHIVCDPQQVLFRRCGFVAVENGLACERTIPNYNASNRCNYHTNPVDMRQSQPSLDDDHLHDSIQDVDVVDDKPSTPQSPQLDLFYSSKPSLAEDISEIGQEESKVAENHENNS